MSEKKYIRFIDSSYNTLFHVANGDSIRIKFEDGSTWEYPCRYIDPTHAHIGMNVFHICEFAERMEQYGRTYEPVKEIGDPDFYQKKYYDRDNIDVNGKPVPYYSLVETKTDKGTSTEVTTDYAFCLSPATPDQTFCKLVWENYSGTTTKTFSSDIQSLCNDAKLCSRINNIVASIQEQLRLSMDGPNNLDSAILHADNIRTSQPSPVTQNREQLGMDRD